MPVTLAPPNTPIVLAAETKRTFKEKMAELVRVAHEQGYLTRDEIHETFSDVWSKPGEEQECFKQLQLLDVQIVESLDLLPKAPLDAELDKHRDAVDDLLRCYLTEIGTVALLKPE